MFQNRFDAAQQFPLRRVTLDVRLNLFSDLDRPQLEYSTSSCFTDLLELHALARIEVLELCSLSYIPTLLRQCPLDSLKVLKLSGSANFEDKVC